MNATRFSYTLAALISPVLLYLAWPVMPLFPLIFVAFIPLFWINEKLGSERLKPFPFLGYTYISLALFNVFTTWWIWNSTPPGALFAMLVNALLMLIPWMAYRITTYKLKLVWWSHFSIVPYYIAFEYWHLNWELSWPWLTLGNAAALYPQLVQWYEYTGVLGGSLWILSLNVLLFAGYKKYSGKKFFVQPLVRTTLLVLLVPAFFSFFRYFSYEEKGEGKEIVVVQPNIDPYTEKYPGTKNFVSYTEQYRRLESLSLGAMGSSTDFVLWPETSFPEDLNEERYQEYRMLQDLLTFSEKHPRTAFLIGADTYRFFNSEKQEEGIVYPTREEGLFYMPYNTGIFLQQGLRPAFYHKSKLVPGVEVLPYPEVFGFVSKSLGEIVISVGKQKERTVFKTKDNTLSAPIICYESIYGAFIGNYVKNGAGLLFIITNDAWWGNTAGHQQHFHYGRLRAVEHRKCVARAANTGISGFFNQKGDIISRSNYQEQTALRQIVLYNSGPTFYSLWGDWIGLLSIPFSLLWFVGTMVKRKK